MKHVSILRKTAFHTLLSFHGCFFETDSQISMKIIEESRQKGGERTVTEENVSHAF